MRQLLQVSLLVLFAMVAASAVVDPTAPGAPWEQTNFAVVGYLPEYRLNGFDYEAAFQTGLTHLLFFSLEIDHMGLPTALDRLPSKADAKRARVAADKVGGKILISFGGNSRSQNFGAMATSPKRRAKFLLALERILYDYEFDGIDYNWEYPKDHAEWNAWGTLMEETKDLLNRTCITTFTMYLDPAHYDVITRYRLLQKAHYVHCMAYDQPRQHSTFAFFKSGIRLGREKGFDLSKLTMGLPFYARDVRNGEPKTYGELADHIENDVDDQVQTYYFNSKSTIAKKVKAARDAGLGGVMIWELGQDVQPLNSPASLMTALKGALPWSVPTTPPLPKGPTRPSAPSSNDDL